MVSLSQPEVPRPVVDLQRLASLFIRKQPGNIELLGYWARFIGACKS